MPKARFVITKEVLASALNLPEGIEIFHARWTYRDGGIELHVEGEGLPQNRPLTVPLYAPQVTVVEKDGAPLHVWDFGKPIEGE